jgi:hypothetical protein
LVATGPGEANVTGWKVDFGDGSPVVHITGTPNGLNHVFTRGPGVYTITAFALIGVAEFATNSLTVSVADTPPVIDSVVLTPEINEGGTGTLRIRFLDPGITDRHTLRIDWGDGVVESILLDAGTRDFTLLHQYLSNLPGDAPYLVSILLTESDGATASDASSIIVRNLAPVVIWQPPGEVRNKSPVNYGIAITDPGGDGIASVRVEFSDGTIREIPGPTGGSGLVSLLHTYQSPGQASARVIVIDDEGARSESVQLFTVLDDGGSGGGGGGGGSIPAGPVAPVVNRGGFPVLGSSVLFAGVSVTDKILVAGLSLDDEPTEPAPEAATPVCEADALMPELGVSAWSDALYSVGEISRTGLPDGVLEIRAMRGPEGIVLRLRLAPELLARHQEIRVSASIGGREMPAARDGWRQVPETNSVEILIPLDEEIAVESVEIRIDLPAEEGAADGPARIWQGMLPVEPPAVSSPDQ